MYLRKLLPSDAERMHEWMQDDSVVHDLFTDFASKTLEDARTFIEHSYDETECVNLAIATDDDVYMGTVSLKHIDQVTRSAEFAITVCKDAMGKGYSWYGMKAIIEFAFNNLDLECVYWCVSQKNKRAVRFYDKHNFHEAFDIPNTILDRYSEIDDLKWYAVLKGDRIESPDIVCGCEIKRIKTIPTINVGQLSFFEAEKDIPFEIKRIYYISKAQEDAHRGFHAHKTLKQLLFCPYGKIELILDDGTDREHVLLDDPSIGVVIDKPIWREMIWKESNSVLVVAASERYEVCDYIKDYNEFIEYIK